MAVLPLTVLGHPILRQATTPVTVVTDELRRLADDMIDTMRAADGVGLAAPQVGRSERPTCGAASPTPSAARMVSIMSSANRRSSSVTTTTGVVTWRRMG